MEERNTADCLLFNLKGEILLQKKTADYKRNPSTWVLFGGKVENKEDPEDTIVREIREEIGLSIKPIFFKKIRYSLKEGSKGFSSIFIATVREGGSANKTKRRRGICLL